MRAKANVQLVDPRKVRHRRLRLGLTETYLGSLCGVSASVIRRLEAGWPQDDLSARFLTLLAEELGTTVAALLADPQGSRRHDPDINSDTGIEEDAAPDPVSRLGAALLGAAEPVPAEVLCERLELDLLDLDMTDPTSLASQLARRLEQAGGVLIDNGSTFHIADDLTPLDQDTLTELTAAAFARRRPNLPELRAIHDLIVGKVVRREDLDTATGRHLARLRRIGLLTGSEEPAGVKSDPPQLSDDVRYSLLLGIEPSAPETPS